jgi:hypothetical protein
MDASCKRLSPRYGTIWQGLVGPLSLCVAHLICFGIGLFGRTCGWGHFVIVRVRQSATCRLLCKRELVAAQTERCSLYEQ